MTEKPPYDLVRERLAVVYKRGEVVIKPPNIGDWFNISKDDLKGLKEYLDEVYQSTTSINNAGLNPDEKASLDQHLEIMNKYFEVLWRYDGFKDFCEKNNISLEFLKSLVLLHDFSRFIFNGSFPLRYTDCVSDGLIGRIFPNFPKEFLHSIGWITGEKEAPNEKNFDSLLSQIIGLVLKAVDTLSKIEPGEALRDPEIFFAKGGGYDRWLQFQIDRDRFPFTVMVGKGGNRVKKVVTAQEYAEKDKELTIMGIRIIEGLCGVDFSKIREQVSQKI